MPEPHEKSVPEYSELAQKEGQALQQWLYANLAEGNEVTLEQVRARVEGKGYSYKNSSDIYRFAERLNEQRRLELPAEISEEDSEVQSGLYEQISFLLHDADTALSTDEGLFD